MATSNDQSSNEGQQAQEQERAQSQERGTDERSVAESSEKTREQSLQDDLNFDPFEQWAKEEESRGEGKDDSEGRERESTQRQPEKKSEQSASETGKAAETSQTQTQELSESDQLKAQLAEMRRTNELLQQRLNEGQTQQSKKEEGSEAEKPKGPSQEEQRRVAELYNVPIHGDVLSRLQSDQPEQFQQGLHQLVQGIGFHTHQQVMQDVQRYVSESVQQALQQNVPQLMQQHTQEQTEGERVRKDFYGTYPQFDKPELHQLVRQTSSEVADQFGISKWSPLLRDETAKAVAKKLEAFGVPSASAQQQPSQQPAQSSQTRSFDSGQGTRGGHTPPDHNSSQEIGEVLFGA